MVQVLEKIPSFGERMGAGLGGGFSQGFSEQLQANREAKRNKDLWQELGGSKKKELSQNQKEELFVSHLLPQVEQMLDRETTIEERTGLWEKMNALPDFGLSQMGDDTENFSDVAQKALMAGEPEIAKHFMERAKMQQKESLAEKKQTFAREQAAEPKLLALEDKLENYEMEGMRFDRLAELFKPELEEKFPPAFLVGAFTKDGELNEKAQAALSPEAQEAVKLITDNIKGAKDSFGARVTNFDAATYLKTLPSLLNTAEGRRRVLRDLKLINQLNQQHTQGVLDIMEKAGGASKMSLSKAEREYKKQFAPQIKKIRQEFISPESTQFDNLPSANLYPGRKATDNETGKVFISDGKEWRPL